MTQVSGIDRVCFVNTLEFKDLVPLATLTRGGMEESFHAGVAVLVDPSGSILQELGNSKAAMFPRSALKPVQALAMRELGLDLSGPELVLSMASHLGTKEHRSLVESLLAKNGFSEANLQCPVAQPSSVAAKGDPASRIAMNCSGKHAAFLATCRINDWDTASYLDPEHPLQKAFRDKVEKLSGEKVHLTTTDGCGAPLFAISTFGLAKAISGFMTEGKDLFEAAKATPWVIGDHDTADAMFLEHGMMSKIGAEGVFVVGLETGEAMAIKMGDGNLRAAPLVALKLLEKNSLISNETFESLWQRVAPKVLGGNQVVGEFKVSF